ncbi:MAG: hypothetical protein ABSG78_23345 [Verrucomicrobiota bacterium]|jgi:hypothetical protein
MFHSYMVPLWHRLVNGVSAQPLPADTGEESKWKKEEDFSANPSKKIHWEKIPFSTARFASIRFRPWQIAATQASIAEAVAEFVGKDG